MSNTKEVIAGAVAVALPLWVRAQDDTDRDLRNNRLDLRDLESELRACCKQCIDTSSRDPAGFDIAIRRCTDYRGNFRGEPGVDERCTKILAQNQSTVRSCQTLLHAP